MHTSLQNHRSAALFGRRWRLLSAGARRVGPSHGAGDFLGACWDAFRLDSRCFADVEFGAPPSELRAANHPRERKEPVNNGPTPSSGDLSPLRMRGTTQQLHWPRKLEPSIGIGHPAQHLFNPQPCLLPPCPPAPHRARHGHRRAPPRIGSRRGVGRAEHRERCMGRITGAPQRPQLRSVSEARGWIA